MVYPYPGKEPPTDFPGKDPNIDYVPGEGEELKERDSAPEPPMDTYKPVLPALPVKPWTLIKESKRGKV